uniref:Uncharacterized protein n=1 Tax=Anguilla anguilla TaxID=7936 RepID=A0A0E9T4K2_ANGAN
MSGRSGGMPAVKQ